MFATIRRHQKWLWFVVISFVIVSFVVYLDPTYSSGRRGSRRRGGRLGQQMGEFGMINGRAIGYEELMEAYQEARLQFFLYSQSWPEENENSRQMFNPDVRTAERLFMVEKLKELDIRVGGEAVAEWIAQVFRDRERGTFSLEAYKQFAQRELGRGGLTEADLQRFARHEVGVRQLYALGGLSGSLVTPREAEALYRSENEQVTAEIGVFSSSNHLAEVIVAPEAVASFFTNQAARYRVPDKVQVSYVPFAVTNFLAEADRVMSQRTNLNAELEALYRQRGAGFFKDAAGAVMTPDAAKEKLRSQMREELAMIAARRKATAFAEQLYSQYETEPARADNLERLAAATGLQAKVTEPFTRSRGPENLQGAVDFTQAAFNLSTNQPMSTEPILGDDAAYVIALKQRIPSQPAVLESVRPQVTMDYRQVEARKLAVEAGRKFYAAVTNGLAQNKTFQAVCVEANVQPIKPPPFSRSTRALPELANRVDLGTLKSIALDLPAGKVSDFEETRDGAMLVHVLARQPVDEARVKQELPEFMEQLRAEQQREAFSAWLRKEMELAQISGLPQLGKTRKSR